MALVEYGWNALYAPPLTENAISKTGSPEVGLVADRVSSAVVLLVDGAPPSILIVPVGSRRVAIQRVATRAAVVVDDHDSVELARIRTGGVLNECRLSGRDVPRVGNRGRPAPARGRRWRSAGPGCSSRCCRRPDADRRSTSCRCSGTCRTRAPRRGGHAARRTRCRARCDPRPTRSSTSHRARRSCAPAGSRPCSARGQSSR